MDLKNAQRVEKLRQGAARKIPNVNPKDSGLNKGPVGTSLQTKASGHGKPLISTGDKMESFEFRPFLNHQTESAIADAQRRQRQLQALDFNSDHYMTLKGKLNDIPDFKAIQEALDNPPSFAALLPVQNAAIAADPALETLSKIALISQKAGSVNMNEAQEASEALISFLKESATPSIFRLEGTVVTRGTYLDVPDSLKGLSQNAEYPDWMRLKASIYDGMNLRDNPKIAGLIKDEASKALELESNMLKAKLLKAADPSNPLDMMKFDVRGRPAFYQEIKAGDDILNDPTKSILRKDEVIQRIYKRIESDIKLIKNEPQDSLVRLRKYSEIMGWIQVLEKPRKVEGVLSPTTLDKLELIFLDKSLPDYVQYRALSAWTTIHNRNPPSVKLAALNALTHDTKAVYSHMLNLDSQFRDLMKTQARFSKRENLNPQELEFLSTAKNWEKRTLQLIAGFVQEFTRKDTSVPWANNLIRDLVEDKLKLIELTPSIFPRIQNFAAKQLGNLKPRNGEDPLPQDNSYGIPGFLNNLSHL
ncbi:hypothetical protein DFH28DRAFT_170350 [Melampsora americana]|nr:hypothetical protein DFH28DRAFT_170350 [Melampsora americana]